MSILCLATALLVACASVAAQDPPRTETSPAAPADQEQTPARPQKLAWPRDRERVICRIDGKGKTLEDLLRHLDERHFPGMLQLVETASGRAYFEHPQMAAWVRQYADVVVLEAAARERGIGYDDAKDALGEALKREFETWLEQYTARRKREGSPVELTQERINLLLTNYQRDYGLSAEVQGWLRVLVPAVPVEQTERIREFYQDHPSWFGGVVTVAQIFVETRDPTTLELKTGKALEDAYSRLADIRSRLTPDGENFEDVARALSQDRRTAQNGGRLEGIKRFDDRLPAAICRTAWQLRDGEMSEPFESAFGIHVLKRIGYQHRYYVIFNDQIRGEVADTMRRAAQEDLLFGLRESQHVELRY